MKLKAVLNISDSCIRHVLKELKGQRDYAYTKEKRRETLQSRIEQFENTLGELALLKEHELAITKLITILLSEKTQ